jgi:hypothetical protein
MDSLLEEQTILERHKEEYMKAIIHHKGMYNRWTKELSVIQTKIEARDELIDRNMKGLFETQIRLEKIKYASNSLAPKGERASPE